MSTRTDRLKTWPCNLLPVGAGGGASEPPHRRRRAGGPGNFAVPVPVANSLYSPCTTTATLLLVTANGFGGFRNLRNDSACSYRRAVFLSKKWGPPHHRCERVDRPPVLTDSL